MKKKKNSRSFISVFSVKIEFCELKYTSGDGRLETWNTVTQ